MGVYHARSTNDCVCGLLVLELVYQVLRKYMRKYMIIGYLDP